MEKKEFDELNKNATEAITALREAKTQYGIDSAEFKEMSTKTDAALEKQEKASEAVVIKMSEYENQKKDLEEKVDSLEKELTRKSMGGGGSANEYKQTEEYKTLNLFARAGINALSPEQKEILETQSKALMRMDSSVAGGYLTSTEMDSQIIKKIVEISPVRRVARVQTIGKKTIEIPVRNTIPEAFYEGEAEADVETASTYANETVTAYRLTAIVPFTMDLLMDADWDLQNEVTQDVSEAYGFKEGNRFVLGSGAKEPEGFLSKASLQAGARETAGSGTISASDMTLLTGDLKVGQNPMYAFNRQTLAFLRTLEDTAGRPIWQITMADNAPNMINGEPYMVMQDMPIIAAGAYSVVYADFMRGYRIVDRKGLTMIRDDITEAAKNIIKLTFHKYNTGQVVLDEAFKLLKIKA